jgi:hypothetical protein
VIDGSTFWSDSAYLTFAQVIPATICSNVESWYTTVEYGDLPVEALISVESSSVSSLCGGVDFLQFEIAGQYTIATPYPFNFQDLEGPIPASAWACNYFSLVQDDPIISEGDNYYNPVLSIPSQLRTLMPEWKDCLIYNVGSFDPPKALNKVNDLIPTTTASPPGQSATPGTTPTRPVATSTRPQPGRPTDQSDPPPGQGQGAPGSRPPPGANPPTPPANADPAPAVTPAPSSRPQGLSALIASVLSSARSRAGQGGSVVIVDPGQSSTLATLTTGEVIGAAQTVVAFDPSNGRIVVSGAGGVTQMTLPSMVVGLATKTTVLVLPRALLTPGPVAAAAEAATGADPAAAASGSVSGSAVAALDPAATATDPAAAASASAEENDPAGSTMASGTSGANPTDGTAPQSSSTKKSDGSKVKIHSLALLSALICLVLL